MNKPADDRFLMSWIAIDPMWGMTNQERKGCFERQSYFDLGTKMTVSPTSKRAMLWRGEARRCEAACGGGCMQVKWRKRRRRSGGNGGKIRKTYTQRRLAGGEKEKNCTHRLKECVNRLFLAITDGSYWKPTHISINQSVFVRVSIFFIPTYLN